MTPTPTILDVMTDPKLFGSWFAGDSWEAWKSWLAALFCLPMTPQQLAIYRTCTQREHPPATRPREGVLVKGRRAGGSRIQAFVAGYLATFVDWKPHLSPGEMALIAITSVDRSSARVLFGYIKAFFSHPLMAPLVTSWRSDGLDLSNGVSIEIRTASFRSIRGYTIVAALCDEIAYWRSDDGSANPDREILGALRPSMATIPQALLLLLSSPYARRGELWTAYERYHGNADDRVLVWQGASELMNPTIDRALIAAAYEEDESLAAAEYGAQFRRDIESFLSKEAWPPSPCRGGRSSHPRRIGRITRLSTPRVVPRIR
ncbi:MAG: hypothetical protein AB7P22_06680 [Vicinamibacterales bacterium]